MQETATIKIMLNRKLQADGINAICYIQWVL